MLLSAFALLTSPAHASANLAPSNLTHSRLDAIKRWSDLSLHDSLTLQEMSDTLASLLLNEASTFTIRGVGTYTGPESILEYLLITRPTFNQGALKFLHKQFELIEWVGDMAVVEHTDTTSASGASSLSESMYRGTFAFAPGVARLHAVHAEPVALFSLLDVDTFSGRALCEQAAAVCPGELYPFASVAECLDVMATLPTTCPDADNLLAGDTIACRYLHLGSSRLNGLVHCPHLRNESTKCYAARCPSATRTAPAPVGDDGGDASLRAVLFAEMAAAVLVFTCFLGSWCSWRHVRRTPLMAHVKARPAAELAGAEALPMPALRGRGFELEIGGKVILRTDLKLGGCRMTAIESTSGFGKSTMFKLLAGARLPYAKFRARGGSEVVGGNVNYCPQDSSFWPEEMRVRDVLLFSAQLHGTRIDDHWETLEALGMTSCLDKLHGQLSGGQKQCMNVAATVMRSTPCLMLLDEPLSALDEQKSLNVLRQLKRLPHSFVVTVHKPSEEVHALFDRVVVLKAEGGGAEPRAICGRKGSITGEVTVAGRQHSASASGKRLIDAIDAPMSVAVFELGDGVIDEALPESRAALPSPPPPPPPNTAAAARAGARRARFHRAATTRRRTPGTNTPASRTRAFLRAAAHTHTLQPATRVLTRCAPRSFAGCAE